jgi:hypothetical protein
MRIRIDENLAVIVWETRNPKPSEPTERYSYLVEYRDIANKLRESEPQIGFFSPEHCRQDALRHLDSLDLRPEAPKPTPEPPITVPYHYHICTEVCGAHRCVNPACEVQGEFVPQRVAETICPKCGRETGVQDFFERQRISIVEFMPLVIEQSKAA